MAMKTKTYGIKNLVASCLRLKDAKTWAPSLEPFIGD